MNKRWTSQKFYHKIYYFGTEFKKSQKFLPRKFGAMWEMDFLLQLTEMITTKELSENIT